MLVPTQIPGDISMRDLEPDQGMLTLRLTKRQVEVEDTRTEKVSPRHTTHGA
jgi:hypothetical protein